MLGRLLSHETKLCFKQPSLKDEQTMSRFSLLRLMLLALFAAPVLWPAEHAASAEGRRVLIHLKTGITQDDNQMCVAFNVAQAAVEAGDDVEMLFDAAAIFDLQNAPTQGETTATQPASQATDTDDRPYNLRYELPDKLKRILSQQFGTAVDDLPSDYYGYLRMLHDRGAAVTFNGAMAHLVNLSDSVTGKESLIDIAVPLGLREMLDHRAAAEVYLVY